MKTYNIDKGVFQEYQALGPMLGNKMKNLYANSIRGVPDLDTALAKKYYNLCNDVCQLFDGNSVQYRISPLPSGLSFHYIDDIVCFFPYLAKSRKETLNTLRESMYKFKNGIILYTVDLRNELKTDDFTKGNDGFILRHSIVNKENLLDENPKFEFI